MSDLQHATLIVACIAFTDAARREWIARNGPDDCPVLSFESLDPASKRATIRVVKATLTAADPKNVIAVLERTEG